MGMFRSGINMLMSDIYFIRIASAFLESHFALLDNAVLTLYKQNGPK